MKGNNINVVEYGSEYLTYSWKWLNDDEIKYLTQTPTFSKEQQLEFFNSLPSRTNYFIKGIEYNGIPVGACGLKHITNTDAEYWGYIGEKAFWGKGIGQFALTYMIKKAQQKNLKSIYLKVIKENIRALNLYKKMGFLLERQENNMLIMRFIL